MENLTLFINQIINGLQVGSIYALVALGYTMVYGIVKLINFAHGDFIMVGAYVALFAIPVLVNFGLPPAVTVLLVIVVSVVVCSLLGMATEKIAYKPLRGSPSLSVLITAIAVSLFLENLFMILFSSAAKPFPAIISADPISFGGIQTNMVTIVTIVISLVCMAGLQLFIKRTRMGKAMRAVSEDSGAAMLMGINSNATISMTFAIGSGLAAVAAVMYCSAYSLANPYMGSMLGLKAFIAAVLGGIGIIPGAMLGGFAIGLVESLTKAYISSRLADAVVFGILIVVLLVKPTGILGKNIGEKV